MSWSSGTKTSSRNTSLNSDSPVIWRKGRTSTPGASMAIAMHEMPLCRGASESVRTRAMPHVACRA